MAKAPEPLTHSIVAIKATKFIKRLHGCFIGAVEFSGGWSGENVDGIAFNGYGSFLIEAKMSRSDFLADKKKQFRCNPSDGVGRYRYFACPEGLIKPEELPEKWGLIYISPKGKVTMPKGYGGAIKRGDTKCPVNGWTVGVFDQYGCRRDKDFWPEKFYSFDFNESKERNFLLYLAKRYKQNKFMENIL